MGLRPTWRSWAVARLRLHAHARALPPPLPCRPGGGSGRPIGCRWCCGRPRWAGAWERALPPETLGCWHCTGRCVGGGGLHGEGGHAHVDRGLPPAGDTARIEEGLTCLHRTAAHEAKRHFLPTSITAEDKHATGVDRMLAMRHS